MSMNIPLPGKKVSVQSAGEAGGKIDPEIAIKLAATYSRTGSQQAMKSEKIDREARMAVAEVFRAWIAYLNQHNPELVVDIFTQLCSLASEAGRAKMMKHEFFPASAKPAIEAHVAQMKANAEAEKAEAAKRRAAEASARLAKIAEKYAPNSTEEA